MTLLPNLVLIFGDYKNLGTPVYLKKFSFMPVHKLYYVSLPASYSRNPFSIYIWLLGTEDKTKNSTSYGSHINICCVSAVGFLCEIERKITIASSNQANIAHFHW